MAELGGAYLSCPDTARFNVTVTNAAVRYRRAEIPPGGGGVRWSDDKFLPPGGYSLERLIDAIKFKSAAAGKPARVTVDTISATELRQLNAATTEQ